MIPYNGISRAAFRKQKLMHLEKNKDNIDKYR